MGDLLLEMMRRIVSVILVLAVSCLMHVKLEATVCPAGPRDSAAMGNAEAAFQRHATPSSQTGHDCCPPVPKEQDGCKHTGAERPECRLKSADCCLAKAPTGQLPPSKTTGPAFSASESSSCIVFRAPEVRQVHLAYPLSLAANIGLQLGFVLRN